MHLLNWEFSYVGWRLRKSPILIVPLILWKKSRGPPSSQDNDNDKDKDKNKDNDKGRDIKISDSDTHPMEKIKGSTFTLREKIKQEQILIFLLNGLYLMIPFFIDNWTDHNWLYVKLQEI